MFSRNPDFKLDCSSLLDVLTPDINRDNRLNKRFNFKHIKQVGIIAKTPPGFKFHSEPEKVNTDDTALHLLDKQITSSFVRVTNDNYELAVNKFDNPRLEPENELWDWAFERTYIHLSEEIPVHKPKRKGVYMDFKRSSGFPCNLYWPLKEDVPEEIISDILGDRYTNHYWLLAMKKERLPITKIRQNKMRSYMMPPMDYLIQQKTYSENFNDYLKAVRWSAYGFNYHRLGFHMKMRRLRRFKWKFEYDATNWDKRFGLKRRCVEMRRRFLDLTEEENEHFWKVFEEEITPKVILPTKEVIEMPAGQCSGSENTTSDNIVAHIMMVYYEIAKGYKNKYHKLPSIEDIRNNCEFNIYSDDIIGACSDEFDFLINPQTKKEHYEEFGMTIEINNPEKFKVSRSLEGLKFLGLKCVDLDGWIVPDFDYQTVVNSTVLVDEHETCITQLNRFIQLLDLLTFNPNYDSYLEFIKKYAEHFNLDLPYIPTQKLRQEYELCKRDRF